MRLDELNLCLKPLTVAKSTVVKYAFKKAELTKHALDGSERYDIPFEFHNSHSLAARRNHTSFETVVATVPQIQWRIVPYAYNKTAHNYVAVLFAMGKIFHIVSTEADENYVDLEETFKIKTGYEISREDLRELNDAYPAVQLWDSYQISLNNFERYNNVRKQIIGKEKRGKKNPRQFKQFKRNDEDDDFDESTKCSRMNLVEALDVLNNAGYKIFK